MYSYVVQQSVESSLHHVLVMTLHETKNISHGKSKKKVSCRKKRRQHSKKRRKQVQKANKVKAPCKASSVFGYKETLRALVGGGVRIYTLNEFLHKYCCRAVSSSDCNLFVIPLLSMTSLTKVDATKQRQSLSSLVDDVVWTLVQQRERAKRFPMFKIGRAHV